METLTFLNHIFHSGIPAGKVLCVWTHPDKVSGWFDNTKQADNYIRRREESSDKMGTTDVPLQTYFGVNLVSLEPNKDGFGFKTRGTTERGKKENITQLNCLVADIDIIGVNHVSAKNYPRTKEDAMRLIASFPIYPTFIVNSGGGYHLYWVFKEPIANENGISEKWGRLLQQYAEKMSYEIDSVFDVSRVLRPVQTKNRKNKSKHKVVDVINHQYDYVDGQTIIDLVKDIQYTEKARKGTISEDIYIKPGVLPQDKLDLLMQDDRFRDSWNMTRNGKDNSPSAHEMSVCYWSYMADLTDGEVFMILRKFRQDNKLPLKNQSYYDNTLLNAKQSVAKNTAIEQIGITVNYLNDQSERSDKATDETVDTRVDVDKDKLMAFINQATNIKFTSFVKMVMDEPVWIAYVGEKKIPLGGQSVILNEVAFRGKIAAGLDKIMNRIGKDWEKVAQAILFCSEKVHMGNYGSDTGMMLMWLSEYIANVSVTSELNDALAMGIPLKSIGYYYITGDDLRRWINTVKGENINSKKMGIDLRTVGGEPVVQMGEVDNKRTSRSMWKIAISSVEG